MARLRFVLFDGLAMAHPGCEPECTAFAQLTFGARFTTHQLGETSRNDQTETCATIFARCRGVRLFEGLEQTSQCVGPDTNTAVPYFEANQ